MASRAVRSTATDEESNRPEGDAFRAAFDSESRTSCLRGASAYCVLSGLVILATIPLDRVRFPDDLAVPMRNHLLHLYGSLAEEVLAPAVEDSSLLEPLVPGRPDLRAQERYAREREWAVTDEDVLRRRTTAWLAGHASAS